jgi:hypothetical protein
MKHDTDADTPPDSERVAFADATHACVASILDSAGTFLAFRDAFPTADQAAVRRAWPELFRGDDWLLPFRAYLVRRPDVTILVDRTKSQPATSEL